MTDNVNNKPAISFTSSSSTYLQISDDAAINNGGPYDQKTLVLAFQAGSDISTQQMVYKQGNADTGLGIYIENDSVYLAGWNDTGTPVWGFDTLSHPISEGQKIVVIFELDTPNIAGWVNGNYQGSKSGKSALESTGGNIILGGSNGGWDLGGNDYFDGKILEFVHSTEH